MQYGRVEIDELAGTRLRAVVHEDGRILIVGDIGTAVLFFIPLPEPMRLPDRWTRPRLSPLDADEYMELARALGISGFFSEMSLSMCFRRVERKLTSEELTRGLPFAEQAGLPGLPLLELPPYTDLDVYSTVVEVFALVANTDERELSRVVDDALDAIRDVQRAYGGVIGRTVTPVARRLLPVILPLYHFDPATPPEKRHENQVAVLPHVGSAPALRSVEPVNDSTLAVIDTMFGHLLVGVPFRNGEWLLNEAYRYIDDCDDAWASLAAIAAACEALLDDILACMLWEEGHRPEDRTAVFGGSITARLRSGEHSSRLGGDWDLNGGDAIAGWLRRVAWRRNAMLHAGRGPSLADARDAHAAAVDLLRFLRDRVLNSVEHFPRTAWMFLGSALMPTAEKARYIDSLLADDSEVHWNGSVGRWIAISRYAGAFGEWKEPPAQDDLALVAVGWPDGTVRWCVVDEATARARRLDGRPEWVPAELETVAVARASSTGGVQSIRLGRQASDPFPTDGEWIAAYRLLPNQPVLVTGDRLDWP